MEFTGLNVASRVAGILIHSVRPAKSHSSMGCNWELVANAGYVFGVLFGDRLLCKTVA